MTTNAPELLPVTQEDARAADTIETLVRIGELTRETLVQAFARHRLNTRPTQGHEALGPKAEYALYRIRENKRQGFSHVRLTIEEAEALTNLPSPQVEAPSDDGLVAELDFNDIAALQPLLDFLSKYSDPTDQSYGHETRNALRALHAALRARPSGDGVDINLVRGWAAKLFCASGCSCCRDDDGWDGASRELAELLNVPLFDDGSGVDWYRVRDAFDATLSTIKGEG